MSIPYSRYFLGRIPWYSLLIVLGASLAVLLADREAKRRNLPEGIAVDLALVALPSGIVGARLYYVLFSWDYYRSDPLSIFRLWEGGLAIYGGLIAGALAVLLFCRRKRLNLRTVLDLIAPGVALAQALGRWGNYFNQEAYGPVILNPSFQFFPLGVQILEGGIRVWHAATFFYASLLDFLLFLFLILARRRFFRRPGEVFGCYALGYAAGRLVLENLRADSLHFSSRIRVSQLVSLLICAMILFLLFCRARRFSPRRLPLLWALPPLLPGIPVLLYCLGWHPDFLSSLPVQMALLTVFSLTALFSAAMLFRAGPTSSPEVPSCPPQS